MGFSSRKNVLLGKTMNAAISKHALQYAISNQC